MHASIATAQSTATSQDRRSRRHQQPNQRRELADFTLEAAAINSPLLGSGSAASVLLPTDTPPLAPRENYIPRQE